MSVKVVKHGPIVVVTPGGTLWGGDETTQFRDKIDELIAEKNSRLVIDLSKVNHLNQTALGVLHHAHVDYSLRGGKVRLCGVAKRVNNLLVITKLSLVFEILDTEAEAIASLQSAV